MSPTHHQRQRRKKNAGEGSAARQHGACSSSTKTSPLSYAASFDVKKKRRRPKSGRRSSGSARSTSTCAPEHESILVSASENENEESRLLGENPNPPEPRPSPSSQSSQVQVVGEPNSRKRNNQGKRVPFHALGTDATPTNHPQAHQSTPLNSPTLGHLGPLAQLARAIASPTDSPGGGQKWRRKRRKRFSLATVSSQSSNDSSFDVDQLDLDLELDHEVTPGAGASELPSAQPLAGASYVPDSVSPASHASGKVAVSMGDNDNDNHQQNGHNENENAINGHDRWMMEGATSISGSGTPPDHDPTPATLPLGASNTDASSSGYLHDVDTDLTPSTMGLSRGRRGHSLTSEDSSASGGEDTRLQDEEYSQHAVQIEPESAPSASPLPPSAQPPAPRATAPTLALDQTLPLSSSTPATARPHPFRPSFGLPPAWRSAFQSQSPTAGISRSRSATGRGLAIVPSSPSPLSGLQPDASAPQQLLGSFPATVGAVEPFSLLCDAVPCRVPLGSPLFSSGSGPMAFSSDAHEAGPLSGEGTVPLESERSHAHTDRPEVTPSGREVETDTDTPTPSSRQTEHVRPTLTLGSLPPLTFAPTLPPPLSPDSDCTGSPGLLTPCTQWSASPFASVLASGGHSILSDTEDDEGEGDEDDDDDNDDDSSDDNGTEDEMDFGTVLGTSRPNGQDLLNADWADTDGESEIGSPTDIDFEPSSDRDNNNHSKPAQQAPERSRRTRYEAGHYAEPDTDLDFSSETEAEAEGDLDEGSTLDRLDFNNAMAVGVTGELEFKLDVVPSEEDFELDLGQPAEIKGGAGTAPDCTSPNATAKDNASTSEPPKPNKDADLFSILTNAKDKRGDEAPLTDAELAVEFDVPRPVKGFHLSSDGGLDKMLDRYRFLREQVVGPVGVQYFVGSPKGGVRPRLEKHHVRGVRALLEGRMEYWTVHASHATNLVSADSAVGTRAIEEIATEMENCKLLGIPTLCIHLGEATTSEQEDNILRVVARLQTLLARVPGVQLALENMTRRASKCNSAWGLPAIKDIMQRVASPRIKACVDICHAYIAHYDFRDPLAVDEFARDLKALGPEGVAGFHVSDSSTVHGKSCDGHANIGKGLISLNVFRRILRDPDYLGLIPYYLETPNYTPIRAADHEGISQAELARHVVEWNLLETVIRVSDDKWDATHRVREDRHAFRVEMRTLECRMRKLIAAMAHKGKRLGLHTEWKEHVKRAESLRRLVVLAKQRWDGRVSNKPSAPRRSMQMLAMSESLELVGNRDSNGVGDEDRIPVEAGKGRRSSLRRKDKENNSNVAKLLAAQGQGYNGSRPATMREYAAKVTGTNRTRTRGGGVAVSAVASPVTLGRNVRGGGGGGGGGGMGRRTRSGGVL